MRPRLLLVTVLLLGSRVSTAWAQGGLNLAWQECLGEGGVSARTFACNTNGSGPSLSHFLHASMVVTQSVPLFTQLDATLYLQSAGASLPAWWELHGPGRCRDTGMAQTVAFSSLTNLVCQDPWEDQAVAAFVYDIPSPVVIVGSNTARIRAIAALPVGVGPTLLPGVEYRLFELIINNQRTTGAGACAGCTTPVSILFGEAKIYAGDPVALVGTLTQPAVSNCVDWQGGSGLCNPTATTRPSWGAVKSLYR